MAWAAWWCAHLRGSDGSNANSYDPIPGNNSKTSAFTSHRHESTQELRHRGGSPATRYMASPAIMCHRDSPSDCRQRQSPTTGFWQQDSTLGPWRRGSPLGFNPQFQRFYEDSSLHLFYSLPLKDLFRDSFLFSTIFFLLELGFLH